MAEAVDGRDMLLSQDKFCGQCVFRALDRRCSPGIVASSVNGMRADGQLLSVTMERVADALVVLRVK